ncbi:MAG: helix-turn-helix domain-containing protein [bacterium]|nr:helix-turn-helix domain-containing protein [bacterium]
MSTVFLAMPVQYDIARNFAAEVLNISERTLDRYVKRNTITCVRRGRQLYFNEKELLQFKSRLLASEQIRSVRRGTAGGGVHKPDASPQTDQSPPSKAADFAEVHEAQLVEQGHDHSTDDTFAQVRQKLIDPKEAIFEKLYEKTDQELKNLRQKFELANYQVGKLESQIKSMVPLLELKRQKQVVGILEQENKEKHREVMTLRHRVESVQLMKNMYAGVLYALVLLASVAAILISS